jgi:hypothetical protein
MDGLPNELLLHVFSYLQPPITHHGHFSTPSALFSIELASLCRVSLKFNELATPLLYESIERAGSIDSLAFRRFPSTLLEHPDLGRHIKNIRLKLVEGTQVGERFGISQDYDEIVGEDREIDYEDDTIPHNLMDTYSWLYDLIEPRAVANVRIDPQDLLKRAIRGEDVLLTLCLFITPNLERLWYRRPATHCFEQSSLLLTAIATRIFFTPVGENHGFEKLKVLHIDLHADECDFPASSALPLLLLPRLVDLTLGGWGICGIPSEPWPDDEDSAYMDKPWTWPVRASSVKRLSLLYPFVSGTMVAKMLHACKAISRFELVHGEDRDIDKETWHKTVVTALLEHANTLTELSVGDVNDHYRSNSSGFLDVGKVSAGSQLTNLRSLRFPLYTLAGYNNTSTHTDDEMAASLVRALPESIEYLWVDLPSFLRNEEDVEPHFRGLYQACKEGRFPRLKDVYLNRDMNLDPTFPSVFDLLPKLTQLRNLFRTRTISFDIHMRLCHKEATKCVNSTWSYRGMLNFHQAFDATARLDGAALRVQTALVYGQP